MMLDRNTWISCRYSVCASFDSIQCCWRANSMCQVTIEAPICCIMALHQRIMCDKMAYSPSHHHRPINVQFFAAEQRKTEIKSSWLWRTMWVVGEYACQDNRIFFFSHAFPLTAGFLFSVCFIRQSVFPFCPMPMPFVFVSAGCMANGNNILLLHFVGCGGYSVGLVDIIWLLFGWHSIGWSTFSVRQDRFRWKGWEDNHSPSWFFFFFAIFPWYFCVVIWVSCNCMNRFRIFSRIYFAFRL